MSLSLKFKQKDVAYILLWRNFNTLCVVFTGLPDSEAPMNGVESSESSMDVEQNKRGVKRPGVDHESDDESSSAAPPVNDIYRSRQQKRVH